MPAGSSVVYDVVTRYSVDDRASAPLRNVSRHAGELSRASRTATNSLGTMQVAMRMVGRAAAGLGASITATVAAARTFANLNQEMEATIQIASSLNLAFRFDTNPARSFELAMVRSRQLVRDLIEDAAKLPGELSGFLAALRTAGLPVLQAGGTTQDLRDLIANLAIVAPMAGQDMASAGRQVLRMLTGQASVGDNPLFAVLMGSGLLPGAELFNKLPQPEKLRALDEALAKLAENPALRTEIMRTFATQFGTLMDTVFGANGILGQIGRPGFELVLDALTEFNQALADKADEIVGVSLIITRGLGAIVREIIADFGFVLKFLNPLNIPEVLNQGLLRKLGIGKGASGDFFESILRSARLTSAQEAAQRQAERLLSKEFGGQLPTEISEFAREMGGRAFQHPLIGPRDVAQAIRSVAVQVIGSPEHETPSQVVDLLAKRLEDVIAVAEGRRDVRRDRALPGSLPQEVVKQTVNIKVDLRSDDSPEAIAVRISDAMTKVAKHPRRATRAPNLTVSPRP